ncbi:MAG: NUDIX domain-containing protein [Actinomycetota bacterium]|nr:NUDIX domain-containing protein [Actinomycetota bacterium]
MPSVHPEPPVFSFCPVCGGRLHDAARDGGARCDRCNRSWYRNSAPTAGCVIVDGGKALVTIRAQEPEKGRFDVVGGFLMNGEHPIDGLKREVKEELGIEIEAEVRDCVQMVPHRYGPDGDYVLALGFKARWVSGEPSPADDVAEIRWITADELDDLDFAWEHDRELVRKALEDG